MDSYRQEDAQQILQIAIARQAETEDLTRIQLVEIAEEMGITSDDLQQAEQEWRRRQGENEQRSAFDRYRQSHFQQHLTKFAIVNTFLVALDMSTHESLSWSLYVVFMWGLAVALDAWKAYQDRGEAYETAFQRWNRQRQLKQTVNVFLDRLLKA